MNNRKQSGRRLLSVAAAAALLFLFAFAASRLHSAPRSQPAADASEKSGAESRTETAAALKVHNSPSAVELGRRIDSAIDEGEFKDARWGIFVMSLRDGRVLYARNADHTLSPASNMKVYTTAVALDLLGADYRWRTSVYTAAPPDKSGTIEGDLRLYGRGAPDLSSLKEEGASKSSLDELAEALYQRGVRRVRGRIVGDESYFRGDPLGDGWLWNDVQWYFGAEISALSVNGNAVTVSVRPSGKPGEHAEVSIKPETDYVRVENETATAERGAHATLGITRGLSDNVVRVWGDFPAGGSNINAHLSVHRPTLWAALLFRDALKRRGITVEGEASAVDARSEGDKGSRTDDGKAIELAFVNSRTLGEVVRQTNKESINLYAELILRTLGKERGATAPTKDPGKMMTRGDDQAGLAVVRQWLQQHEVPTGGLALHDGSGLSRLDLVTPLATVRLLAAAAKSPASEVFRDSLPIAGRDGTLKYRMRGEAAARILAKTGTLTYINSLSGYATTADNEPLAFSIICNDETAAESSTSLIDRIATLLANYKE